MTEQLWQITGTVPLDFLGVAVVEHTHYVLFPNKLLQATSLNTITGE